MRRHYTDPFEDFRGEIDDFYATYPHPIEEEDDDLQLAIELSKMESHPPHDDYIDPEDEESILKYALEESSNFHNQNIKNIPIDVATHDEDEELKLAIEMSLAEKEEREKRKNNDDEPIDPNILQRIEFEETVQKDLEREKQRQEEREFQQIIEMEKKLEEEKKEKDREMHISKLKERLGSEPSKNEENTTLLKFRLFNNEVLTRRFRKTDKIGLLYDFIELYLHEKNLSDCNITLNINTLPKKVLNEKDQTIQDADVIGHLIYVEED